MLLPRTSAQSLRPFQWSPKSSHLIPSAGFDHSISSFVEEAHHLDWVVRESINIPIHQYHLSKCIDNVCFNHLLSSPPDSHCHALVLSFSLPHTGDWLSVMPSSALGLLLQDRDFAPVYNTGWGFRSMQRMITVLFASPGRPYGGSSGGMWWGQRQDCSSQLHVQFSLLRNSISHSGPQKGDAFPHPGVSNSPG